MPPINEKDLLTIETIKNSNKLANDVYYNAQTFIYKETDRIWKEKEARDKANKEALMRSDTIELKNKNKYLKYKNKYLLLKKNSI